MNGYHQLALFVVLFGGFLGWGLWENYKLNQFILPFHVTVKMADPIWVGGKLPDNFYVTLNDQQKPISTKNVYDQVIENIRENRRRIASFEFEEKVMKP